MQRKALSRLWLSVGVIGLLLLALSGVSAQQPQPVFRIGVLDEARGAISNGARLAVREINAAGGVRGADGTTFNLDLVIEPSSSGLTLEQALEDLQANNVIAVLGPETSGEILNGMAQLQSLGVPVITPATDDTLLTADASGLLFRARAADALQGQTLASYLINDYQLSPVATIQLDVASTARVVGFTTAASTLGVTPQPAIVLSDPNDLTGSIIELAAANPAVIVAYGEPDIAATLYSGLRAQNWSGVFAYNQAFDPIFRAAIPLDELSNVVAVTTWPFTATDLASATFLNSYIHAYGELPDAVQAASYDSVNLIAKALAQPGNLRDNLETLTATAGVQGVLRAPELAPRELSNNTAIVRVGELGAPEVLARYQGNQRLPADNTLAPIPIVTVTPSQTATPVASPTPQGVSLTITQQVQNVRNGPGDAYEVIGQLNRGDQAAIIGASADYTWVVINFRGTQGWLATYLLDVTGDLRSAPVVPAPPVPTLDITATPTTEPYTDVIIVSAAIVPNPILPNQTFTVNVTVGNIGNVAAGTFAVAGMFPPNNTYLVGMVPGLAPGQTAVVTMSGMLSGTGSFTTSLQIDANNQVNEGIVGEQNNIYNLSYTVGVAVLNQGSQTLNLGDTLDLEGNLAQGDVNWNANDGTLGLKGIFGGLLGNLGNGDFNAITYDSINPSITTRGSIPRTEMSVGTLIGIRTADGHRGVMQVTAISDTQITVNFRVYNG